MSTNCINDWGVLALYKPSGHAQESMQCVIVKAAENNQFHICCDMLCVWTKICNVMGNHEFLLGS